MDFVADPFVADPIAKKIHLDCQITSVRSRQIFMIIENLYVIAVKYVHMNVKWISNVRN